MDGLKPCPFCGEHKLLYSGNCGFKFNDDDNQIRLFGVRCRTCKARTGLFESLDEATKAWNRRATCTNLAEVGTDCISRQAAIDVIGEVHPLDYNAQAIKSRIESLPSAQPKMGRWIHHPEIGWDETWLCDQCGEKTTSTVMGKPRANFCPNCGADMRGEQDE